MFVISFDLSIFRLVLADPVNWFIQSRSVNIKSCNQTFNFSIILNKKIYMYAFIYDLEKRALYFIPSGCVKRTSISSKEYIKGEN